MCKIIKYEYTYNGKEYKGTPDHELMKYCLEAGIKKKYTKVKRPQTNGKAERVIKTLMDMGHSKETFISRENRKNVDVELGVR